MLPFELPKQMRDVFHAQILEVRKRRLAQHARQATGQRSLTCVNRPRRCTERQSVC
jgi:hypothetical protein